MVPDPIEAIQRYTEAVRRGDVRAAINLCPSCHREPGEFHRHDCRERTFRVIVGRVVRHVTSLLTRWNCPLCGYRFTLYPDFALPRKLYVRHDVFERARAYLERDELSYRQAVQVDDLPVFFERDEGDHGAIDERSLSHSTLHRWCPLFSSLGATLREARRLLRAASPTCDLFRRVPAIAPAKYRSEARGQLLAKALAVLWTDHEFHVLFARSVFPELATACAWG